MHPLLSGFFNLKIMGWDLIQDIYTIIGHCNIYTDDYDIITIEIESITYAIIKELEKYLEKKTTLEINNISAKKNKVIIDIF